MDEVEIQPKARFGLTQFFYNLWWTLFGISHRDDSLPSTIQIRQARLRDLAAHEFATNENLRRISTLPPQSCSYADLYELELALVNYLSPSELAAEYLYIRSRLERMGFKGEDFLGKIREITNAPPLPAKDKLIPPATEPEPAPVIDPAPNTMQIQFDQLRASQELLATGLSNVSESLARIESRLRRVTIHSTTPIAKAKPAEEGGTP